MGEKHLIFVTTEGLFLPRLEDDWSLASLASDARVRIHNLQTGGTHLRFDMREELPSVAKGNAAASSVTALGRFDDPRKSQPMSLSSVTNMFALSSLETLSDLTGGRAFIGTDIGKALSSLNESISGVYVLGYRPEDERFDGRFRRIEVRVKRKGLRVYARNGYYARPLPGPYDREQSITYARTVAAAKYDESIQDVTFSFDAKRRGYRDEKTFFDVNLKVQLNEEMFVAQDAQFSGRFAFSAFFFSADRRLSLVSDTIRINLEEPAYRDLLRDGLDLSLELSFSGQFEKGWLKIVLYEPLNDQVGSFAKDIK